MEESDELFKLFTPTSLFNIEQRIAEEAAQKKIEKQALEEGEEEETPMHEEEEAKPNPKLEAGKKIPLSWQDDFSSEYIGKPMEDFDEFFDNQKVKLPKLK
ncbi:hypothetical protein FSP39_023946 [Pinctada imbricata]|uniref:Uncharacterized protein n=1 Tax=Pinctada imbricata TaxID=66713 RepID=A0AA88XY12_PINIB|nr:hypothetical protein FSP39_023946 [Pinctada imbricata]